MSTPHPAPLRLRTSAYVFFEDVGSLSLPARLAAIEVVVAALWGAALLGFLVALLTAPYASAPVAAAIIGAEVLALAFAIGLSVAWLRGHRTPVLTADSLVLEGTIDDRTVPLADITHVEIGVLGTTEPPLSRVSVGRRDGSQVRLDLPREDALVVCRELQRRLFGGGSGAPYDSSIQLLDRGNAPVAAWVARLRERFAKTGYRHAAGIAEDELHRAVHDPGLPTARRVGAALALSAAGGPEGREHLLRIAAHLETASLRIAVERAAEGTLAEAVLAEAEAEDAALGRGQST